MPAKLSIIGALFAVLVLPPSSFAKPLGGEVLLSKSCGRCHAVGKTGKSPMKKAPPFREIASRYAPKELETVIMQGAVSHYPAMPQIQFSPEDAAAIVSYLDTIKNSP